MQLVLVRHADAEPELASSELPEGYGSGIGGDFGRALTVQGQKQARDTGLYLAEALDEPLTTILTSPLVRTLQTSELLSATLTEAKLSVSELLRPGASLSALLTLIRGLTETTVLVGHEPTMGELGASLLRRGALPFAFGRAAALILKLEDGVYRFNGYRVPFCPTLERL